MRLFLDSSVVFSICKSKTGAARELLRLAIRNKVELVISEFVLAETELNLNENAPHSLPAFYYLRAHAFWQIVNPTRKQVMAAIGTTPDRFDAPIVAAAKAAEADALVSFDRKHLHKQSVADHIGAPVLTAGQALKLIQR